MTVTTNYNVNDVVYILYYNKVEKCLITGIKIKLSHKNREDKSIIQRVEYELKIRESYQMFSELFMFSTREELLASL